MTDGPTSETPPEPTQEVDLVIVGSGGGGMVAALTAADAGLSAGWQQRLRISRVSSSCRDLTRT